MTVAELIEKLQELPQDTMVAFDNGKDYVVVRDAYVGSPYDGLIYAIIDDVP